MIEYEIYKTGEAERLEDVPKEARVIAIDGRDVAGKCEACGRWTFFDEAYACDEEGTILCPECAGECARDYEREAQRVTHEMALDAGDPGLEGTIY